MINEKHGQLTKDLQSLQALVTKINTSLQQERVSYELINGDVQAYMHKRDKLLEVNKSIEEGNAKLRVEGQKALEDANKKAEEKVAAAHKVLIEALTLSEETKRMSAEADKVRFEAHREKLANKKETVEAL